MRQVLTIFLFSPLVIFAQHRDSIPIKKANRIIIVTNKPAKNNYQFLQIALENGGYTIDLKNEDSLTVQTAETRGNSVSVTYHLNGIAKENEIILFGKYTSKVESSIGGTGVKDFVYDISNTGKKGSASQFTFQAMDDVAKLFKAGRYYMILDSKKTSLIK
ncbi:MAG TPA: hypothetical protein VGQ09_19355 [Chitinophagaceae bacterium]|nr:hypothetical protein [Chitinophagaceae bacterium]